MYRMDFQFFVQKCIFLKKKYNSETKMKFEKKSLYFCRAQKFHFDWYKYQLCRLSRLTVRFVTFSVNNSFSIKKMEKSSWRLPHCVIEFTYQCKFSSETNE